MVRSVQRLGLVVAAAVLGIAGACDILPTGSDRAKGPDIAFLGGMQEWRMSLFVMDRDGSEPRDLTPDLQFAWSVVWSPDGRMLAFAADRDSIESVYVINVDGSGLRRLTSPDMTYIRELAWLPSGRELLFTGRLNGENLPDLWRIRTDGSGLVRLVRSEELSHRPDDPYAYASIQDLAVSPDGRWVAWTTWYSDYGRVWDNKDVMVARTDGTGIVNLTRGARGWNGQPSWFPDSRTLAFSSDRDGNREIYRMGVDGSGAVNLTRSPGPDVDPSVSPDGRKVAFISSRTGPFRLFVMDADGGGVRQLSDSVAETPPRWSPDGAQVAWTTRIAAERGGSVAVVNADGSGSRVLATPGRRPTWRPRKR